MYRCWRCPPSSATLDGVQRPQRIETEPGQESVWDYPRPPRVERSSSLVEVVFNDLVIVSSTRALRVLETSHPPTYYLPPDDVLMDRCAG